MPWHLHKHSLEEGLHLEGGLVYKPHQLTVTCSQGRQKIRKRPPFSKSNLAASDMSAER